MTKPRDSGATALETAIVFPGLILAVMTAVQFGLVAYSHHVVGSATQSAAVTAASQGVGAGTSRGNELLAPISGITTSSGVSVSSSSQELITMAGSAQVVRILPLMPAITVRASGSASVERFRPEGD